ncbi:signal peptidase II [Pontibacter sp. G13]|uniref:signal peptidase II n=1 Tax=Pontibacter sp. G13 TaxID=3074898 RepID=UPI0028893785|nr:signal peptidase II [Pontibacter sp. G13]WNJ21430.1 signal peptidase II [Pontibacter sp. G13]
MNSKRKYFLIALGVVLLDQSSKLVVKLNMDLHQEIRLLGDFFKIHFIENPGAAFGVTIANLFSLVGGEMSEWTGKMILSIFSILAVCAIAVVLYRMANHKSALPLFIALILGGALGNIIDRTFYGIWFESINAYEGGLLHGRVVDMFYFDLWKGFVPHWVPLLGGKPMALWPIFNIADAAITIGIVVILLFQGRFFKKHDEKITSSTSDPKPTIQPSPIEPPTESPSSETDSNSGSER